MTLNINKLLKICKFNVYHSIWVQQTNGNGWLLYKVKTYLLMIISDADEHRLLNFNSLPCYKGKTQKLIQRKI